MMVIVVGIGEMVQSVYNIVGVQLIVGTAWGVGIHGVCGIK